MSLGLSVKLTHFVNILNKLPFSGLYDKLIMIVMTIIQATLWSFTLEPSIMLLEASITLLEVAFMIVSIPFIFCDLSILFSTFLFR
jgi:hypothetical protein